MEQRFHIYKLAPDGYRAMSGLEAYLAGCGLDRVLMHLVKLRASQVNGCAFCIDMHWKDLRAAGETEQRLYGRDAWRESPYYSDRERAALAWTEAITLVTQGHVPDEEFAAVRAHFTEKELADLTLVITTINAWNRLSIAQRTPAGAYTPKAHVK
jgi:AhpD family alkylhydroperoxidase